MLKDILQQDEVRQNKSSFFKSPFKIFRRGRRCLREGCKTVLTIYNPNKYCFFHISQNNKKRIPTTIEELTAKKEGKMKVTTFAEMVAELESGKKQVNIAQIKEILKHINQLFREEDLNFYGMIRKMRG